MGDVNVIYGNINGTVLLALTIGVLVLFYVAISRIISKAGYPWVWLIVPLVPLGLLVASVVVLYRDHNTLVFGGFYGIRGIETVGILWKASLISLLANLVMFLVFAFSRWPTVTPRVKKVSSLVPTAARGFSPDEVGVTSSKRFGKGGPGFATNAVEAPAPSEAPTPAAPVATVAPVASSSSGTVVVKRCVWCGEALPGSRALFHDCGPTDRPPAYCAKCGTALAQNSTVCATCGP
jgi:hypothetical protein